jgi:hypothetical protein
LYLSVVAGAVSAAGVFIYPYTRAAETNRYVEQAETFAREIVPVLERESRFDGVRVSEVREGGAGLIVHGWVDTQGDLDRLHQVIDQANPPVKVRWSVYSSDAAPSGERSPM